MASVLFFKSSAISKRAEKVNYYTRNKIYIFFVAVGFRIMKI